MSKRKRSDVTNDDDDDENVEFERLELFSSNSQDNSSSSNTTKKRILKKIEIKRKSKYKYIEIFVDAARNFVSGLRIPTNQQQNPKKKSAYINDKDDDNNFTITREKHLDWSNKQRRILTCNGMADSFYTHDRGFPFTDEELPHYILSKQFNCANPLYSHTVFKQWKENDKEQKRKKLICITPPLRTSMSLSIVGAWKRPLFYGGFEHSTDVDETVINLQSSTLFIDLRIPVLSRNILFDINYVEKKSSCHAIQSIHDLTIEQLKYYGRQHIFAGYSKITRKDESSIRDLDYCTRHHCIDWNYVGISRTRPNKWFIEFPPLATFPTAKMNSTRHDVWKEYSFATDSNQQHYYCERWERLVVNNVLEGDGQLEKSSACQSTQINVTHDSDSIIILVLRLNPEFSKQRMSKDDTSTKREILENDYDRDGIIILCGNQFNYCISRSMHSILVEKEQNDKYKSFSSKVDYVDALIENDDIDEARKVLSTITGGHGVLYFSDQTANTETKACKWQIDTSIEFWKEGTYLFSPDNGMPEVIAQMYDDNKGGTRVLDNEDCPVIDENEKINCHILWNDERWDIFECQNIHSIKELKMIIGCKGNDM
jgi:hypothetical protein